MKKIAPKKIESSKARSSIFAISKDKLEAVAGGKGAIAGAPAPKSEIGG